MDWDAFFPIILFLLAFGLPMLFRLLRKGGQKKPDELIQHLQGIGVKASVLDAEEAGEKWGQKRSWGDKVEVVMAVEDRDIGAITVVSQSSQYGTNRYIEYLVKWRSQSGAGTARKTSMVLKKSPPLWGKAVDIEWKGDPSLAPRLNFDYQLKYRLLQDVLRNFKGGISIHPESKHGYSRIRTGYQLPSPELIQVIGIIARHIKVGS